MRVALVSRYSHIAGGAEVYLRSIVPLLKSSGCALLLAYETPPPPGSDPIAGDSDIETVEFGRGGTTGLNTMHRWRPDVVFSHGLDSVELLRRICADWPVVHFAHDYQGLCISGTRAWKRPEALCGRALGPACLGHYLPNGCGGASPLTMFSLYSQQRRRRDVYQETAAILTNSEFVRNQLIQNGLPAGRVVRAGLLLPRPAAGELRARLLPEYGPWRLLFMGRMFREKGGHHLIEAAVLAADRLATPLEVTFVGEGGARAFWERQASQVRHPLVRYHFAGWRSKTECEEFLDRTHALALPSVWPEPLGLSGMEATMRGIPVAAYRAGGIPEWLSDGVNGHMPKDETLRPDAFAAAIVSIFENREHYARLSQGGIDAESLSHFEGHAEIVLRVLRKAAETPAFSSIDGGGSLAS